MIAQCFRDLQRGTLLDDLVGGLDSTLLAVEDPKVRSVAVAASLRLAELRGELSLLLASAEGEPSWDFRLAVDRLTDLFFLSRMCAEEDRRRAQREGYKNLELLRVLERNALSLHRGPEPEA